MKGSERKKERRKNLKKKLERRGKKINPGVAPSE